MDINRRSKTRATRVARLATAAAVLVWLAGSGPAAAQSGRPVAEVAAAAERAVGKPIARQIGPRRPGDPARLIADSARRKRI